MNKLSNLVRFQRVRDFMSTVWPAMVANDSELRRRKKTAIRIGQVAIMLMIAFVAIGTIAFKHPRLAAPQAAGLLLASLVYSICFLHGLRETVRWMLWEREAGSQPLWPPPADIRQIFYFAMLFGFAGVVCVLEGRDAGGSLLPWLVLLPTVSLSVFRLRWPGIVLVTGISLGIHASVGWWHGWPSVTKGVLDFSFGALFALLFPALAVTSEKARTEVEHLAGELSAANRKLRDYAAHTEELAVTRERNRLAREIHDSLGHYLTVVNVQIEAARALRACDPARMDDALKKAQALTQQGLQDIRRSVATLRASPWDDQPLTEALRQLVDQGCASGLAVEIHVRGESRGLSPLARLTLYRAGQEGLTNARKHSGATQARLVLDFHLAKVILSVTDNGVGATSESATIGRFGLLGLRERAQLLGGSVRVQTAPDAGFYLEIEVPE